MAAKRPKEPRTTSSPTGEWRLWIRIVVTLVLGWHLAVVFLAPLSVPPTSPLVSSIAQSPWVRWYSDPLYLNHGYHFFGPDPPLGGQLVRYQVYGDDRRVIAEGEFPSLKEQWPRLWYHRHMMLADQMSGVGVYGDPQRDKELMLKAYGRHLLRKHDGAEVRIETEFHESLHPADVRNNADPADPRYYRKEMNVVQRRGDLDAPLVPPADSRPGQPPRTEEISIGAGR